MNVENYRVRPVEFKILLEVEEVEKVSKGGIYLPETTRDRDQIAQEAGTIIAMGECACSEVEIWGTNPPKVGDRVIFSKYAGATIQRMGRKYRLIQDKDLGAVIESEE